MDACRRPSRTRPFEPTELEQDDDFDEDWCLLGVLAFTTPLDPGYLPPLGNLKPQLAWLSGFAGAWLDDCCATCSPVDDDVTLYTAITATLRDYPVLLLELMAIPAVGGSGPH
jgi:hypothetical protein